MTAAAIKTVQVVDSHTGGEPTRVVVSGGPDLRGGTVADRLSRFRDNFDSFRAAVVRRKRPRLVRAATRRPAKTRRPTTPLAARLLQVITSKL